MLCFALSARADRVILSPDGYTLNPYGIKLESMVSPALRYENRLWAQFSTSQSIEFEYNRNDFFGDPKPRNSFNVQYPILTDLGATPAVSIGVRDIFASGLEKGSFYLSVGKSIPLSDRQIRFWRELRLSGGLGTSYFNGPFIGVQARLRSGLTLQAEFFRNRPNLSVGLPVVRNLQLRAYSLNGDAFFGFSYTLAR
jgi:hypothetical protein